MTTVSTQCRDRIDTQNGDGDGPETEKRPRLLTFTERKTFTVNSQIANAGAMETSQGALEGVPSIKAGAISKPASRFVKGAMSLHVYTDGACQPNPGRGGWGFVVYRDGIEVHAAFGGAPEDHEPADGADSRPHGPSLACFKRRGRAGSAVLGQPVHGQRLQSSGGTTGSARAGSPAFVPSWRMSTSGWNLDAALDCLPDPPRMGEGPRWHCRERPSR